MRSVDAFPSKYLKSADVKAKPLIATISYVGGTSRPGVRRTGRYGTSAQPAPPTLAVYAGRQCIGFIRPLGDAFEALDLDRRSLGLFASRSAAADAIEETRR